MVGLHCKYNLSTLLGVKRKVFGRSTGPYVSLAHRLFRHFTARRQAVVEKIWIKESPSGYRESLLTCRHHHVIMLRFNLEMGDWCHKACFSVLEAPLLQSWSYLKSTVVTVLLVTAGMAQRRKGVFSKETLCFQFLVGSSPCSALYLKWKSTCALASKEGPDLPCQTEDWGSSMRPSSLFCYSFTVVSFSRLKGTLLQHPFPY